MDLSSPKNLLSTSEAGKLSGYSSDYLARLVKSGKIRGTRIGRNWFLEQSSFEEFIRLQGDRKEAYARELARAREMEYRKARSPIAKTARVLTTSVPMPTFALASSWRSETSAVAAALLILAGALYGAPRVESSFGIITALAQETAQGFSGIRKSAGARFSGALAEASDFGAQMHERTAAQVSEGTGAIVLAPLALPDPSSLALGIPYESASGAVLLRTFAQVSAPVRMPSVGALALGAGIELRDLIARAPQAVNAFNLAFGESVIGLTHLAINADVALAYGLAEAAPASARISVGAVGTLGNALAQTTARAPRAVARTSLALADSFARFAPQFAARGFAVEYALAQSFVGATDRVLALDADITAGAGNAVYQGASLASTAAHQSAFLSGMGAKAENTALALAGKAALALDQFTIPATHAGLAAAAALSVPEQTALYTYTAINSVFGSVTDKLAGLFAPAPVVVPPGSPARHTIASATTTAATTTARASTPLIAVSNPTYQTVVQGISAADLSQSLASFRDEVLSEVHALVTPVANQTVTNLQTIQVVNRIQDLSDLTVHDGSFIGGSLTGATNITTHELEVTGTGTSTFAGPVDSADGFYVNGVKLTGAGNPDLTNATGLLAVANGGTGISTAPAYGELLVGNSSGGYDLVATSSLGIASGGGSGTLTGLGSGYGTTTAAAITFSTSTLAFNGLTFGQTIVPSAGALTFTPTVSGYLGIAGGGIGTTTAPTYGELLLGNASGGFDYVATSSLGIVSGTNFTASYPLVLNSDVLSLAFGTSTSNTWGGTQTFTTAPVLGSLSGLIGANNGALYQIATSSSFITSLKQTYGSAQTGDLTFATSSQTLNGQTIGLSLTNVGGTFTFAPTISGTLAVAGGGTGSTTLTGLLKGNGTSGIQTAIAGTDYLAPSSLSTTFPLAYNSSTGAFTYNGISTSSNPTIGALSYWTSANTLSSIATSSLGIALSDTTGTLAISRGGTGTSTAPSYGQLLIGNSAGSFDYVATSSLGLASGSSFGYPFPNNATSTGLTFSGGIGLSGQQALWFNGLGDANWTLGMDSGANIDWFQSGSPGNRYWYFYNHDDQSVPDFAINSLYGFAYSRSSFLAGGATTSPFATLAAINGPWSDNPVAFFIGSSTSSYATTTLFAIDRAGTITTALGSGLVKSTSGTLGLATAGTDYENPLTFSYPLQRSTDTISLAFGTTTVNTWNSLQTFGAGFLALASTTIGDGTQTGGLTISGGATTTGNAYLAGNFGIGTEPSSRALEVSGTAKVSGTLTLGSVTSCSGSKALQTNGSGDITCGTIATGGASSGGGWTTDNTGDVGLSTTTDRVAIGASTTPYAKLSVISGNAGTTTVALVPASGQTANILDIYDTNGILSSVFTAGNKFGIGSTSPFAKLSVAGSGYFDADLTASNITATGTVTAANLSLGSLNGPLQANNGLVSATSSIGVTYGGTGLTSAPTYGQLLVGNASGGYTLTATSSLGLGTVSSVNASGGTTGLSFSGGPITSSGTLTLAGTLNVVNGGTGSTTLSGILVGNGTSAVNTLTLPSFLSLSGSTLSLGTLGIANGGTGTTTGGNTNGVEYYNGSTLTNSPNFTFTSGTNALSIPSNGSYNIGGNLLAYASSTNGATIFGLNAGGNNATTSATVAGTTAIGTQALTALTNGSKNTALGYQALLTATTSSSNTAVGYQALKGSGSSFAPSGENTAVGQTALTANTTGFWNTGIGSGALFSNTTGISNTAVGRTALLFNVSGAANVALGQDAGRSITGTGNVALGVATLGYGSGGGVGDYNIAIGYNAGFKGASNFTGSGNILLGTNKDSIFNLTTGNNNIGIGYDTIFPSATANNQLNIGGLIFGTLPATTTALTLPTSGSLAIGSTSPFAKFAIQTNNGDTATTLFAIGSSTASATSTLFSVNNIGSTTLFRIPSALLTTDANDTIVGTTTLGVTYGGTGLTSAPSYGNLLVGNSSGGYTLTATSSLGLGTVTSVDASGGTTGLSFSGGPITSSGTLTLSGTLNVANGGTGSTTLSGILVGNGTSAVNTLTLPSFLSLSGSALSLNGALGIANGGTGTTTGGNTNGVEYYNGSTFTNNPNFTFTASNGQLSIPSNGSYSIGGSLFAYASSTNHDTILGLGAGGQNATTSAIAGNLVAIGWGTLTENTSGINDIGIGQGALANNTTGSQNVAIGSGLTLAINSTGSGNIAVGDSALLSSNGDYNTAVGRKAGSKITTGYGNIFLGANPDTVNNTTTGGNNIGIGYDTIFPSATANNQLNIGNFLFGTLPATTSATTLGLPITGSLGIGTTSPFAKFAIQTNNGDTATTLFAIGSSTASATSTLFSVNNIGSTTLFRIPSTLLTTDANGTIVGTTTLGVTYGGTGLTSAPTYGQLLVGNASGGYTLTATSSLGLLSSAITALGPTGQTQTGPTVTLASSTDSTTGLTSGITITGSGNTLTFKPTLSGTLNVGNGGTGATSFTTGNLLYGAGSGALQSVATTSATLGLGLSGTLTTLNAGGTQSLSIATSSLFSGTAGQLPYFSGTNTLTATSSLFLASNGNFGIGTTSPWGLLSVNLNAIGSAPYFVVGSSTRASFIVDNSGNVGVNTDSGIL